MRGYWVVFIMCLASSARAQFVMNSGLKVINSADVKVSGDWDNKGSTMLNNGIITLSDNWTSTGGYDPDGTGGFVLMNTATRQFNHSRQQVSALTKNGAGITTVNDKLTIRGNLSLLNGVIAMTGVSDTLVMLSGVQVTGNSTSYVVGKIRRHGAGNLYFPVSKSSNYLPITIFQVTGDNPVVTVSVEDKPAGYTAGTYVSALTTFPYVWRSTAIGADTAGYVEVQYPSSLSSPAADVLARNAGQTFASMGAQNVSVVNGTTTIKSDLGGLKGLFTVAVGLTTKVDQELVFESIADKTLGDPDFTLHANASSGMPVNFSSTSPKASVTNDQVTLIAAGLVSISAAQPGNSIFNAAPEVTQSFCINPPKPVITILNENSGNTMLVSDVATGNQWYKDGTPIDGATSASLDATAEGVYSVEATVETCKGARSNEVAIVVTGTESNSPDREQLVISPNPVQDLVTVYSPDGGVREITVFKASGERIQHMVSDQNAMQIDVRGYSSGYYLIRIATKNGTRYGKFIKK